MFSYLVIFSFWKLQSTTNVSYYHAAYFCGHWLQNTRDCAIFPKILHYYETKSRAATFLCWYDWVYMAVRAACTKNADLVTGNCGFGYI